MRLGTRSVLFGIHQPLWHGPTVWAAYHKLYGREAFSMPVIVACFVHDLGYFSCKSMDGPDGVEHPRLGARIMHRLFDKPCDKCECARALGYWEDLRHDYKWHDFALYHSRSMAVKDKAPRFSKLCVADKLALSMTPWWFYIPIATLTGEIKEYMAAAVSSGHLSNLAGKYEWFVWGTAHMQTWAERNKDNAKPLRRKAA